MKFKFVLLAIVLLFAICLSSCGNGEKSVDVGYWGIISLPNGSVVEGKIESLTRWSHSMTEITINGKTYCVHPLCVAVVESEETE